MKARLALLVAVAAAATACTSSNEELAAGAAASGASAMPMGSWETSLPAPTRHRFASLPDRGALVRYPDARVVRHDGAYTWHRADLSESHARAAIRGMLAFTTPAGELLRFRYERHVEHSTGDWTWVGSLVGDRTEEAVITFGAKAAFGTISQPGKQPLRLTIRNGASWLVETDPREVANIGHAGMRRNGPDFLVAPEIAARAGRRAGALASGSTTDAPQTASQMTASSTTSSSTTVDLVLGYTPGFVSYYGGESQAQTRLNNLVEITNEGYVNSQIAARMRLVKTIAVNYTDANSNETALEELTGFQAPSTQTTPAPAFDGLRAAREQYGADLVSLVRRFTTPENDGCGIAWLLGGGKRGSISSSSEYFGYSVVSDGQDAGTDGKTYFCREETLAHELGHNMGSAHDRDTSDGDDNVLQTSEYGVLEYSFGYKTASGSGNFFTIMAYGESGQTRYRVFSNPRVTYCGGFACGVENQADNARSISQTIATIAGFRATVVAETQASRTATDINGDGRSDLVWRSADNQWVHYWLMDGSNVLSTGAMAVAPECQLMHVGDISGDGRSDLVWTTETHVIVSLSNGTGFSNHSLGARPGHLRVVGGGDINGDGRDDLLWRDASNSAMYVWLLDGASRLGTITLGRSSEWTVGWIGDTNGDKFADVVWVSGADVAVSMSTGAGFDTRAIGSRPTDYRPAGGGDIDGNGTFDLYWMRRDGRALAYWKMDAEKIVHSSVMVSMNTPWQVAHIGDLTGDGKADVVWSKPTELALTISFGGDSNTVAMPARPQNLRMIGGGGARIASVAGDIDGDGRADLLFRGAAGSQLLYHLMDGVAVKDTAGVVLGSGWALLAQTDVTGDGRADVVWDNAGTLLLSTWDGSRFDTGVIGTRPAGWSFLGAGDINGDGGSDLVWRSADGYTVHVWIMERQTVLRSLSYELSDRWKLAFVADMSGDGRADLVWQDGSAFLITVSYGTFLDSLGSGVALPAGQRIVGGGDLDGDGRADVYLRNSQNTELTYWVMEMYQVLRSGTIEVGSQWRVAQIADLDGNGYADVAWGGVPGYDHIAATMHYGRYLDSSYLKPYEQGFEYIRPLQ